MKGYFFHIIYLSISQIFISGYAQKQGLSIESPEVIASGFIFTEGPFSLDKTHLIFSDIPANKVYQWHAEEDSVSVYINNSGKSNGIESLPNGDIVLAQHNGRISKVLTSGEIIPLVTAFKGKALNSPNDLAITKSGIIFFTDPTYGVQGEPELDFSGIYRLDQSGNLSLVYDQFELPNGIALSEDESLLYVNDSKTGRILKFKLNKYAEAGDFEVFASVGLPSNKGAADGMILDKYGHLFTTGPNGLTVFNSEGKQLIQIKFEEQITNLAWTDDTQNQLYITASDKVYRVKIKR